MTEIELKLAVPPAARAAVRAAVATASAQRVRLRAAYADTADQRLAAAGFALRLRQEGRRWVQTLKGRGDGLLARLRLGPQRTPAPVFDSLLSESVEDLELRRKLAAGQAGSVR